MFWILFIGFFISFIYYLRKEDAKGIDYDQETYSSMCETVEEKRISKNINSAKEF